MKYKLLNHASYVSGEYEVHTIRSEDMAAIGRWRNEQIDVLRQTRPLSEEDQRRYYENTIIPSFTDRYPRIMLFSYFYKSKLIGYGGLTNLDWVNLRAEISFLLETGRSDRIKSECYSQDLSAFLDLMKKIAFGELKLHRLFTETFDVRPFHISILEQNGFRLEGRMRDHVKMNGMFVDSLIHGCLKE